VPHVFSLSLLLWCYCGGGGDTQKKKKNDGEEQRQGVPAVGFGASSVATMEAGSGAQIKLSGRG
jgi:hypothetical protein